ncbi:hypothetical protein PoB_003828400 [Plakobranchus ocellatus]|uniref:Uncharacterized protein n=1 Tax=Plakobranchus ocellatus TaxID=259542 RepID=A0AAV4AVG8_9GAST|nr:hypothetical protein PoB_003828400 [Plakobranchus ocellatus]
MVTLRKLNLPKNYSYSSQLNPENYGSAKTLFQAAVAIVLLLRDSTGGVALPAPTLQNPCRETAALVQVFPSLSEQLDSVIETTQGASDSANELLTALQGDGFLTENDIGRLTAGNLQELPLRNASVNLTTSNMDDIVSTDHTDMSTYIVFVREALVEQHAFDNGILTRELNDLKTKLFASLCKVKILLMSRNIPVPSFDDSSAMPEEMKNIKDATIRYSRDYKIANHTKDFLESVSTMYYNFLETTKA